MSTSRVLLDREFNDSMKRALAREHGILERLVVEMIHEQNKTGEVADNWKDIKSKLIRELTDNRKKKDEFLSEEDFEL